MMSQLPAIVDDDDEVEGRPLTALMARFVSAYVSNGSKGSDAAIEAGYAPGSAAVTAYRLVRLRHVQVAIREEQRRTLGELRGSRYAGCAGSLRTMTHPRVCWPMRSSARLTVAACRR